MSSNSCILSFKNHAIFIHVCKPSLYAYLLYSFWTPYTASGAPLSALRHYWTFYHMGGCCCVLLFVSQDGCLYYPLVAYSNSFPLVFYLTTSWSNLNYWIGIAILVFVQHCRWHNIIDNLLHGFIFQGWGFFFLIQYNWKCTKTTWKHIKYLYASSNKHLYSCPCNVCWYLKR